MSHEMTPGALSRSEFLLDPSVIFLNHGSYGACPIPIYEEYQKWQAELENQPVEFLGRRAEGLLSAARERIAPYLNASASDVVFVQNATMGVNTVARSLHANGFFKPGDEILATDHEYGACDYTWQYVCQRTGARYIQHPVPLPVTTHEDFVESLWGAVTPRTRLIFISHLTSPTALIFPVAEICRRAREAGIMTVIDGAHAPGQIPIDLQAIAPDIYTGNFHKWVCSPKGSAFLYVRPEFQDMIDPLVLSWGMSGNLPFVKRHQMQPTRDIAAYLTVPTALDYQRAYDWDAVRERCNRMARELGLRLSELMGTMPIAPDNGQWFGQMIAARLPDDMPISAEELKRRLYDAYHIEIPITQHQQSWLIRASIQAYNTQDDCDQLVSALRQLLSR